MVLQTLLFVFTNKFNVNLINLLIMTGIQVKEKIKSAGVNLADLAKLLGYDNDQRLHSALKALDVKSGLLEDIARVTNKNVCWFYGVDKDMKATSTNNNSSISMPTAVFEQISKMTDTIFIQQKTISSQAESINTLANINKKIAAQADGGVIYADAK